jgi:glutathione synthase/RimK-type ligase-like ATP-grasp enzyme
MPRLLLLTPDPDYPEPFAWAFHVQAEALREAGAEVSSRPWTQAGDLEPFDAVLPLVAWGYHLRYAEWLALLDRLEGERRRVLNPVPLLRWNSDKAYLTELGAAGVPTVPTLEVDHLNEAALAAAFGTFGTDEVVVKPPVSAGGSGTYRLCQGDGAAVPEDVHGKRMMIQPWLPTIQTTGEFSLILFAGELSHTVVKRPRSGDFRVQPNFGGETVACEPPAGALDLARRALALAPGETTYARVDLVEGTSGELQVMELELIEPALFLHCAEEAKPRFAGAILSAAERSSE